MESAKENVVKKEQLTIFPIWEAGYTILAGIIFIGIIIYFIIMNVTMYFILFAPLVIVIYSIYRLLHSTIRVKENMMTIGRTKLRIDSIQEIVFDEFVINTPKGTKRKQVISIYTDQHTLDLFINNYGLRAIKLLLEQLLYMNQHARIDEYIGNFVYEDGVEIRSYIRKQRNKRLIEILIFVIVIIVVGIMIYYYIVSKKLFGLK